MAKRTDKGIPGSNPKDFWATPDEALLPLLDMLPSGTRFIEPCAGAGAIVDSLTSRGHVCAGASDIAPQRRGIKRLDAVKVTTTEAECCITNPPYSERLVKPLLRHWVQQDHTTWLLIPLDWLANLWFSEFAGHVHQIVPIGRVKWIKDSPSSGFENSVWTRLEKAPANVLAPRADKRKLRRLDRRRVEADLLA